MGIGPLVMMRIKLGFGPFTLANFKTNSKGTT